MSSNLVDLIRKHFDLPERRPIEEMVREATDAVMLEVAFSPVLEKPGATEPRNVIKRDDGTYALVYPNVMFLDSDHYEPVSEADLKVMRARYLVTRGEKYTQLRAMPDDERCATLHKFFPGGVFVPAEGSELAAAMKMETSDGRVDRGGKK